MIPDQFLQTREWGLFQESLGRKVFFLPNNELLDPLVAIQLPLKGPFFYLYCPRGPVYELRKGLEQALTSLRELAKTVRASFVRTEPFASVSLHSSSFGATSARFHLRRTHSVQPTDVLLIDLTKKEEVLFSEMSSKCRYNIKLAAKKGVVIERITSRNECTDQILEEFTALLQSTSSRNDFYLHPISYYSALLTFFLPEQEQPSSQKPYGRLYLARYEGKVVAAVFILFYGNTANYLHGGSLHEYRQVMAPYALHMAALFDTQKLGYTYYDFGGITLSDDPSATWAGITKFKKSFGGSVFSYPGTYDIVVSPFGYALYRTGRFLLRK